MRKRTASSFERVFAPKELFRGNSLAALLWSALSSVLLFWLLFVVFLASDLLAGRGKVALKDVAELTHYSVMTHQALDDPEGSSLFRTNQGLRATVWRERDRSWVDLLLKSCRSYPVLQNNKGALAVLVLFAVALGLGRNLLISWSQTLSMRTGFEVVTRLRRTLHRQTLRLGPSDVDDSESEHVMRLFTTEMDLVRDGIAHFVFRTSRHPFELICLLTVALSIHWILALQCLIPLGACWYLVKRERRRSGSERRLEEDRSRSDLRILAEGLKKTRLVRGYGMESFEHDQFQTHLDRFREKTASVKSSDRWSRWSTRILVMLCITIVMYLVGIKVLTSGSVTFAAAVVLMISFVSMYWPMEGLWSLAEEQESAGQAADRIYRYINQIPEVGQAVGAKVLQPLTKTLCFEAVTYQISKSKSLLDQVELTIKAGESVAFISFERLEARAMAYLLPRFIEPHAGRVLFDGEDSAWVTLESLRADTIYVGGSDPFFTGTVYENISCGNPKYLMQAVIDAAKLSHAHDFIQRLSQGYNTMLGEHGEQLDLGQSFRLGLARAALRDPALLIVEEPEGRLDDDAKSDIDDTYSQLLPDRTLLFLPSRLSTMKRVDRIVLIQNGKVVADGPHAKLVQSSALYRHWEYIKFNEFRHALEPVGS